MKELAGAALKVTILLVVGLYAGFGFIFGMWAANWSGWGAGLLVGSLCLIGGAFLSWRRPTLGGLLILVGGILGGAGFGFSGVACIGGCMTYTATDEIHVSIGVGIVPTTIGFAFVALGLLQRRAIARQA